VKVTLRAITQPLPIIGEDGKEVIMNAEEFMIYCARVSNPSNQLNVETAPRLAASCIRRGHWSVFEHSSMTIEIVTSRAIAAQILRHRSFTFQEFSQRYAAASTFEPMEVRFKGSTNRQGSLEAKTEMDKESAHEWGFEMEQHAKESFELYNRMIDSGVAPETARMILPLSTQTILYMTGSVRSWIHYLQQRCDPHAQKEHRLLAEAIRDQIFKALFPNVSHALGWLLEEPLMQTS
jgi:thymidylate synthase (FAD)